MPVIKAEPSVPNLGGWRSPGGDRDAPVQPLPGLSPTSCSGKGLCTHGPQEPWQSSLQVSGCAQGSQYFRQSVGTAQFVTSTAHSQPGTRGHHTQSRDRHVVAAPPCEASSARSAHATQTTPCSVPEDTRVSDRTARTVPSPVPPCSPRGSPPAQLGLSRHAGAPGRG